MLVDTHALAVQSSMLPVASFHGPVGPCQEVDQRGQTRFSALRAAFVSNQAPCRFGCPGLQFFQVLRRAKNDTWHLYGEPGVG